MKLRLLLTVTLLFTSTAFAQFSLGLKGGVPVTDFVKTGTLPSVAYLKDTHHWTVGPTFELHLPKGLSLEADALYQRVGYRALPLLLGGPLGLLLTASTATANSWEFPVLLKYRAGDKSKVVRPFLDGGVAFHSISGFNQIGNIIQQKQLVKNFDGGVVVGAGFDAHVLVHLEPEIRYTRWFRNSFTDLNGGTTGVQSNRNQIEFLVGLRF